MISSKSARKDEAWYVVKILEVVKEHPRTMTQLGTATNADYWDKKHRRAYDAFHYCRENYLTETHGVFAINAKGLEYLSKVRSQVSYEPSGTVEWKELFAEVA